MINDVVLVRIVVKAWKYADDLLLRLACYRDPDLPQKLLSDTWTRVFAGLSITKARE